MYSIKRKLETSRCIKCNENPSVTISGDSFKLNCCCDDFKSELTTMAKNEIEKQSKKYAEDELKCMFKKF